MSFTYGFYNSKGGDRKYNAEQMSSIFDGIINDGVFANVGRVFATIPGEGLQIVVGSGRAWFNSTWSYNDAAFPIALDPADPIQSRIDSVILEVDRTETVRRNRLLVLTGSPSSSPNPPVLKNTDLVHQHRLANITVTKDAKSINASNITNLVGTEECPFVTGILQTASIEDLFLSWNEQFTNWFEKVQSQLSGDVAGALLLEINQRLHKVDDKASSADMATLTDDTKWVSPAGLKSTLNGYIKKTFDYKLQKVNAYFLWRNLKVDNVQYSRISVISFDRFIIWGILNANERSFDIVMMLADMKTGSVIKESHRKITCSTNSSRSGLSVRIYLSPIDDHTFLVYNYCKVKGTGMCHNSDFYAFDYTNDNIVLVNSGHDNTSSDNNIIGPGYELSAAHRYSLDGLDNSNKLYIEAYHPINQTSQFNVHVYDRTRKTFSRVNVLSFIENDIDGFNISDVAFSVCYPLGDCLLCFCGLRTNNVRIFVYYIKNDHAYEIKYHNGSEDLVLGVDVHAAYASFLTNENVLAGLIGEIVQQYRFVSVLKDSVLIASTSQVMGSASLYCLYKNNTNVVIIPTFSHLFFDKNTGIVNTIDTAHFNYPIHKLSVLTPLLNNTCMVVYGAYGTVIRDISNVYFVSMDVSKSLIDYEDDAVYKIAQLYNENIDVVDVLSKNKLNISVEPYYTSDFINYNGVITVDNKKMSFRTSGYNYDTLGIKYIDRFGIDFESRLSGSGTSSGADNDNGKFSKSRGLGVTTVYNNIYINVEGDYMNPVYGDYLDLLHAEILRIPYI